MISPSNPKGVSGHTPWTYVPTDPAYPEYGGELISGDGKCVAMVGDPATGAQILAAVNAHDDLVAALRDVLETDIAKDALEYLDNGFGTDSEDSVWLKARAALAKAGVL